MSRLEQPEQEQKKDYNEKINYPAGLLLVMLSISKAMSLGLTGKPEMDYLKAFLIPQIHAEIDQKIEQLDLRFDKIIGSIRTGAYRMPNPTAKKEYESTYHYRDSIYMPETTSRNQPKEYPCFSLMNLREKMDLYQVLRSGSGADDTGTILIGDRDLVTWLHRRHILEEFEIIMQSPTVVKMLLSTQRDVEKGSLSLFAEMEGEDEQ